MGKSIHDIYEKVVEGERVSYEEGIRLYESSDLITLGTMANLIRQRKHGDYVYFNKIATSTLPMCVPFIVISAPLPARPMTSRARIPSCPIK
jgi:hypothetical protein